MKKISSLLKGFTLIELMIVVAIIGILAAIAIPNFVKFQCRSKQTEAKSNMKAMYVAETAYRAEFDVYIDCTTTECGLDGTGDLGFSPKGAKIRYAYAATAITSTSFAAFATVLGQFGGELSNDIWDTDDTGRVENVQNGCK